MDSETSISTINTRQTPEDITVLEIKLWGDERNPAILLLHGVLDNAGAFDNLISHLPDNFYYICVDLPSHGRSSLFHLSLPIHIVDYTVSIKILADYFNREKYMIIGHSLGGQLGAFFTQLYPHRISKLILLDSLYLIPYNPNAFLEITKNSIERLFKTIEYSKKPKQIYNYEEAVQKIINGRDHGGMTRYAAVPLIERMFEKVGDDKYIMHIDSRLKDRLHPSGNMEYIVDVHKERIIKCPVLVLLSTQRDLKNAFEPIYNLYVERKYEIHIYEGHHDVHNTNPEVLAPKIVKFLLKDHNKL